MKKRLKLLAFLVVGLFLITCSQSFSEEETFRPKSESKALLFSVLGTIAPISAGVAVWARDEPVYGYPSSGFYPPQRNPDRTLPLGLIISGIVVGPSLGYLYGAPKLSNFEGLLIRSVLMAENILVWNSISTDNAGDFWGTIVYIQFFATIISTGAVLVWAVNDIAKVKAAVREYNRNLLFKNSWNITPKYFAKSQAGGLELQFRF